MLEIFGIVYVCWVKMCRCFLNKEGNSVGKEVDKSFVVLKEDWFFYCKGYDD